MTQDHRGSRKRRLERFARRAGEMEDALKDFSAEAGRLRAAFDEFAAEEEEAEDAGNPLAAATQPARPVRHRADREMMQREALAGVTRLEVRVQPDGNARVSINGREPFVLPPKLRVLLDVLSTQGLGTDGHLIAWRTRSEVSDACRKRLGGPLGRHDVTRSLYRLRRAFRDAGENEYLLQRNREHGGLRFALRADAVRIWEERCEAT
jgi:hypothetical protein